MTTESTIPLKPIVEPTEISMPPVTITAIMPSATIATKAKLRVTLNKFCDVAKVDVANDSITQATIVASTTQNTWLASSPVQRVCVFTACGSSSNVCMGAGRFGASFNSGLLCLCEAGSGGGD